MPIEKKVFGKTKEGETVTSYLLKNQNGLEAEFLDYGAIITRLLVPDKKGGKRDIALGYDTVEDYETSDTFFGAFIGRNGNRIGKASFQLNGKNYTLEKNDGENNLHSGLDYYTCKMFEVETFEEEGEVSIEFSRLSPDMEQGFPGNLDLTVSYTLTQDNALVIEYFAISDEDTIVNLTNHTYFNLSGHNSGAILNQKLRLDADRFAVTDKDLIPTGEFRKVEGTPMDFRTLKRIGEEIDADYEPIRFAGGYDHHFLFNHAGEGVVEAGEVVDEDSGITMKLYTDRPGVQLYTGNFITPTKAGKEGFVYQKNSGFCLETQAVPDAVHLNNGEESILKAGKEFDSTTIYKFGTI